jgi:hypothetical protein
MMTLLDREQLDFLTVSPACAGKPEHDRGITARTTARLQRPVHASRECPCSWLRLVMLGLGWPGLVSGGRQSRPNYPDICLAFLAADTAGPPGLRGLAGLEPAVMMF